MFIGKYELGGKACLIGLCEHTGRDSCKMFILTIINIDELRHGYKLGTYHTFYRDSIKKLGRNWWKNIHT
jgi:hypothetical protein